MYRKGNKIDCNNYRGIMAISSINKQYGPIVKNYIEGVRLKRSKSKAISVLIGPAYIRRFQMKHFFVAQNLFCYPSMA